MKFDRALRIATVLLLAVIALQLGGWEAMRDAWRRAAHDVNNIGKPEETVRRAIPGAAPSGLERLYQKDIDAALDAQVRAQSDARAAAPAASR